MLISGLRFVLQRIADVADRELNDPERWRTALLEAQLELEGGAIGPDEFAAREREILDRLRELQPGMTAVVASAGRVTGVDVVADFDDGSEDER